MFSTTEREVLRARLEAAAAVDERVSAAAVLGSAARGELDAWSDIDLALRLVPGAEVGEVADAWTARVAETAQVVDHLDIHATGALYRVLLLDSSLQVDLSFRPHDRPLSGGPPVTVLFGDFPTTPSQPVDPDTAREAAATAVRMGWLYALHVRSALGRGRTWQAWSMLEAIRDVVVTLCCRRLDLPVDEGRGVDRLPPELLEGLGRAHPDRVEPEPLRESFGALVHLLLEEAGRHDLDLPVACVRVMTGLARPRPSQGVASSRVPS